MSRKSGFWLYRSTRVPILAGRIMAFATSVPELFVGITSALAGKSALALGNVIGANIINLTLVIGIAILLGRGIKIESKKTKTDALYRVGIASLPMVLMIICPK